MYSNELVCKIIEYLNTNINKEITIDELSINFYFDKTYIMKRFKKELGITIHEYINYIRIYNSLNDFNIDNSILYIGIKNGFNSIEYFSETFKKVIGVSPITYKKFIISIKDISYSNEEIIKDSIIRLKNIKDKTIKYLNNRKPKSIHVKTIFRL